MPEYSIYKDLSGGLNDTISEVLMDPRELTLARNVNLDRDGAVAKRKGATKFTSTPYSAGAKCNMAYEFLPTGGSAVRLFVWDNKLVSWDGVSWTLLYTFPTAGVVIPIPFSTLLFMTNGIDPMVVYNPLYSGTPKVWRAGLPAPASLTKNSDIAGSMTAGTIYVRVRFVSPNGDNVFGEPFPTTADGLAVTVTASGGVRMNIPTFGGTDYLVAKRIIERTKVGLTGTFYYDGQVADNTTTTYDITQSDAALEANEIMPDVGFRLPPPAKLLPAISYSKRLVGADVANLGRMVWSEIDEFGILPEAFPDVNYLDLDVEDSQDAPVAVAKFGESLMNYCGRSMHQLVIDEGGAGASRRLMGYELGIPSPRGVVELPNGNLVWTYRGPYLYAGDEMIPIGERIEAFVKSLSAPNLVEMFAIHRYDDRQVKWVLPSVDNLENDQAAVYHYRRQTLNPEGFPTNHAWTIHNGFRAKSGAIFRDSITKKDLEISGDYSGYAYTENIALADDHDANGNIDAQFSTIWLDCQAPHKVKQFLDLWIVVKREGSGQINVSWETSFGSGPGGSATLNPADGTTATFDSAVFDTATFASGINLVLYTQIAQDGVIPFGKYIRFTFGNSNANETFTIVGLVIGWDVLRDREDHAP